MIDDKMPYIERKMSNCQCLICRCQCSKVRLHLEHLRPLPRAVWCAVCHSRQRGCGPAVIYRQREEEEPLGLARADWRRRVVFFRGWCRVPRLRCVQLTVLCIAVIATAGSLFGLQGVEKLAVKHDLRAVFAPPGTQDLATCMRVSALSRSGSADLLRAGVGAGAGSAAAPAAAPVKIDGDWAAWLVDFDSVSNGGAFSEAAQRAIQSALLNENSEPVAKLFKAFSNKPESLVRQLKLAFELRKE